MSAPAKDRAKRTVRDPHHDGVVEWCVEGGTLYSRHGPNARWQQAKRVSFTPARILAIASLIDRCFMCDEPWDDDHPKTCPEWPEEARDA